jgi:hypothetical protein
MADVHILLPQKTLLVRISAHLRAGESLAALYRNVNGILDEASNLICSTDG